MLEVNQESTTSHQSHFPFFFSSSSTNNPTNKQTKKERMVLVTPAPPSEEFDGEGGTKSTKISTLETNKKSGNGAERRLVEYFVVVSSVPKKVDGEPLVIGKDKEEDNNANVNATAPTDWKVTLSFDEKDGSEYIGSYEIPPIITARYPIHDHRDNPLHENVTFFCHPSGGIRLQLEAYMPKVSFCQKQNKNQDVCLIVCLFLFYT